MSQYGYVKYNPFTIRDEKVTIALWVQLVPYIRYIPRIQRELRNLGIME